LRFPPLSRANFFLEVPLSAR